MTDDEIRALLAPRMRKRTRFVAIDRPAVPALNELAPATDHPDEPALIAALDDDARLVYADWLEQHGAVERAHWLRIYPDGDFLLRTRFGGQPAALRGEPWPRCTCGDPLRFVGQVRGADAAEPAWFGLVTFFFCWSCCRYGEQDCGGAERPYRGWVVRAYPTAELDAFERLTTTFEPFGEGFVRGVHEKSLPHYMHYVNHIVAADVPRLDQIAYEMTDRPGHGERPIPMPRNSGLALGGYAYWYNGPDETPSCPACNAEMELLVQLDVDDAVEASWGDAGTLFIFSCTRHRDMFALRMQCT
ncbi:MAG: DUF1963 domain-containing protein [Myxococcota bacterium]|nr:DUF1963 domain-containing protein [Myxococcota bacterium]